MESIKILQIARVGYPYFIIVWIWLFPGFTFAQSPTAASFYEQALNLHRSNDLSGAIDYYTEALRVDQQHWEALYNRSMAYYEMEKYRKAKIDLDVLLVAKPNDATAHAQRGRVHFMLQDPIASVEDYSFAMKQTEDGDLLVNRGLAHCQTEAYTQALEDFENALQQNPNDVEAIVGIGDVHFAEANFAKAIDWYNRALELQPEDGRTYNNRANAFANLGDRSLAIADYERAIQLQANSYIYTNRAFYRKDLGDLDGALADATEASRLDFENGNAFYCLGSVLLDLGKNQEALDNLNQAVALHPDDPYFWNKRGCAALALQAFEDAIDDFDQAIELKSNLAEAYSNRAAAKHQLGNYNEAVSDQSKAIDLGGSHSKAIARLAIYNNALERANDPVSGKDMTQSPSQETKEGVDEWQPKSGELIEEEESFFSWSGESEATTAYSASVTSNHDLWRVNTYQHLLKAHHQKTEHEKMMDAEILLNAKKYQDAEMAFNRILEQNSSNTSAFNGRGLAKYHTHRYIVAIKDFNIAIQMDPDYVDAFYNRGNAYLHRGKLANALSDFNKTLQLDADFAPAFRQRAAVYMQQEKYDRALEDYNKYLKIRPEDAGAYNNRATLKYITGNVFGAMEDYDIGLELDPEILTMYLNQADLKNNCGQREEALSVLNSAMKYHRHSAEVWFKRGQIQQEMSNYKAAIADFDRAIELSHEERGLYYFARGKAFMALNWQRDSCEDLNKAVHLGINEAHSFLRKYCLD